MKKKMFHRWVHLSQARLKIILRVKKWRTCCLQKLRHNLSVSGAPETPANRKTLIFKGIIDKMNSNKGRLNLHTGPQESRTRSVIIGAQLVKFLNFKNSHSSDKSLPFLYDLYWSCHITVKENKSNHRRRKETLKIENLIINRWQT